MVLIGLILSILSSRGTYAKVFTEFYKEEIAAYEVRDRGTSAGVNVEHKKMDFKNEEENKENQENIPS